MTKTEWLDKFSKKLNSLMIEQGYSQKSLAEETGLDRRTIARYINGDHIPTVRAIINLVYALDCSIDELIDFDERIM